MTFGPPSLRTVPRWAIGLSIFLAALSIGTCINLVLVANALHRVSDQARGGAAANERQCALFPISRKLYEGGARYGLLTAQDYKIYLSIGAPKGCHR
jgi:hypothetical protein